MEMNKKTYENQLVRVMDTRLELDFLQSGGDGNIDPGIDDPWGDY